MSRSWPSLVYAMIAFALTLRGRDYIRECELKDSIATICINIDAPHLLEYVLSLNNADAMVSTLDSNIPDER